MLVAARVRLLSLLPLALVLGIGCATTTPNDDESGDDDDAPVDAAPGFIDAAPSQLGDAAPLPGIPDAALPGVIDAGPTGPFCTDDSQCNASAHECCWKFIPPFTSGLCTYGDVIPILGCVPGDPPDAGP